MVGGGGFLKKPFLSVNQTFQSFRRPPEQAPNPSKNHRKSPWRQTKRPDPASFPTIRLKRGDYSKPTQEARSFSTPNPQKIPETKVPKTLNGRPVSERGGDIRAPFGRCKAVFAVRATKANYSVSRPVSGGAGPRSGPVPSPYSFLNHARSVACRRPALPLTGYPQRLCSMPA